MLTAMTGWISGVLLARTENSRWHFIYLIVTFFFNLIRSVPQIVGILIGYAIVTALIQQGILKTNLAIFLSLGVTITLFIFLELTDLIRERIAFFKKRDFYNAMLTCGISEGRIINREILFKNSLSHIFNKLISVFGITIFLQCSIDFIVSVGLSTAISAVNFPATLGNQLAKIDSKQDILAIGHTLTSPSYFPQLFLQHLQGISVAFVIVFFTALHLQDCQWFCRKDGTVAIFDCFGIGNCIALKFDFHAFSIQPKRRYYDKANR